MTRDRVYNDLQYALVNKEYIELIIDRYEKRMRMLNVIIASSSSIGGASVLLKAEYINSHWLFLLGWILPFISAIAVIANQFSSSYLLSPSQRFKLNELYVDFTVYSDKLLSLFDDLQNDNISSQKAKIVLEKLNTKYANSRIVLSSIFGKTSEKLREDATEKSNEYLRNIYFPKTDKEKQEK